MDAEPVLNYSGGPHAAEPPPGDRSVLTAQQLAMLACRVLALWLFLGSATSGLASIYYVLAAFVGPRSAIGWNFFSMGGGIGLTLLAGPIAAGTFLWFRADRIAARMMPASGAVLPSSGGIGYSGLLTIALAVTGVQLLVPSVGALAGAFVFEAHSHANLADWWRDPYWIRQFCSSAIQIAAAAWLLLGGRGVVNLINRARTAGHGKPAD